MASFADRFNSLKDQARQKIEALKEDEQIQKAWGQARQKYDEISESGAVKNALQKGQQALSDTRQKFQDGLEESKQGFRKMAAEAKLKGAENHVSRHEYMKAIAVLEEAIKPDSEFYDEAQSRIAQYQQLIEDRRKLITSHKGLFPIEVNDRLVAGAEVDGFTYFVWEVKRTGSISNAIDSTYADGVFYIIRMAITNNGKSARHMSASFKTLIDSEGREFQTSSKGETALSFSGDQSTEFLVSQFQPGVQTTVSIVFDVAPNADDLKLKVGGGMFGGGVYLPLELL